VVSGWGLVIGGSWCGEAVKVSAGLEVCDRSSEERVPIPHQRIDELRSPPTLAPPVDTLHFAYGSNMDARQMARRCPRSRTVGLAELPGWRFRINSQGWATIIPDSTGSVFGRLWTLPPEDEAVLDLYEDLPSGLYTKQRLLVTPHDGGQSQAMTYLAADSTPGIPVAIYFQPILAAAIECGFPEAYLRELQQWAPARPSIL